MHQLHPCPQCLKRNIAFDGICWECKAKKHRQEVLSWSDAQVAEKIEFVSQNISQLDQWGEVYETFYDLFSYRGIASHKIAKAALEQNIFCEERIFYRANDDVRDALIQKIRTTTESHIGSSLLSCLSMQGDEVSLQALLELELNPAPWQQKLYVPPSVYAQGAGWTFDKSGARTSLLYETCYSIENDTSQHQGELNCSSRSVAIAEPLEEKCPYCEHPLVTLLDVNADDPKLSFFNTKGRIKALCCVNCFAAGNAEEVYTRYHVSGEAKIISSDSVPFQESYFKPADYAEMQVAAQHFALSASPVPLFYNSASEDVATLGGHAKWLQDWHYLTCPECNDKMHHLAQIPAGFMPQSSAGMFYISICSSCQITGVINQRT